MVSFVTKHLIRQRGKALAEPVHIPAIGEWPQAVPEVHVKPAEEVSEAPAPERKLIFDHPHIDEARSRKLGRTVHRDEEPYIARKNYGRVHFRASKVTLTDGTPFTLEEGKIILTYDDQTEHASVSGGSGSGKTLSVLNQGFDGYFRACHLPDGPDRERLKTAGLIIEAKGDFLSKVWSLAQRYGRMDDLKIFGPTHPEVINLFGDPTENALQRANKLLAMAKAFAGGKRAAGQDSDFWDSAARKLFMHVCLLHEYVKNYHDSLEDEEEKKKFQIPPFTFQYLNLMLMDKGRPLNDEALQSYAESAREAWKNAKIVFERTRHALQRMILVLSRLDHHLKNLLDEHTRLQAEIDGIAAHRDALSAQGATALKDEDQIGETQPGSISENEIAADRRKELNALESREIPLRTRQLEYQRAIRMVRFRILGKLATETAAEEEDSATDDNFSEDKASPSSLVHPLAGISDHDNFRRICENADAAIAAFLNDVGEGQDQLWEETATLAQKPGLWITRSNMTVTFQWLDEQLGLSLSEPALDLSRHQREMYSAAAAIKKISERKITPEIGALKKLLEKYEIIAERRHAALHGKAGFNRLEDSLIAYFIGEYLNVANDKTSGSVAMVASTMIAMLIYPPFNRMFGPAGTVNFATLIDEGQILYLDMPTSMSTIAQEVASVAIKIDFFRNILLRQRLTARDGFGRELDRLVNQDRFIFYFSDEFGSVATTGNDTGEADVMDKVREFKCGFMLGFQSFAILKKKLSDHEIDAIMTNVRTVACLANNDSQTNEYNSKRFSDVVKANGTLNRGALHSALNSTTPGERDYTTQFTRGARVEPSKFQTPDKGEAYLVLPSRYAAQRFLRVNFTPFPILPPGHVMKGKRISTDCPFPGKLQKTIL
jgi:Type IV secretion-system coupling protein DNA-binding domain